MTVLETVRRLGRAIKFSHSIFALPFALASFVLAARVSDLARPTLSAKLVGVIVAMVGARTAAMAFNRVFDAEIDARNPRTAGREIPTGQLTKKQMSALGIVSALTLIVASASLGPLCLALSPVALAIIIGYSWAKRVTSLTHLILGLALAIAPVGAWIAVRGRFEATPFAIGLAVLFWVAGFDILYACQDARFDRREGLHSIPAQVGVGNALLIARLSHAVALVFLAALPRFAPLHPVYLGGVLLIAILFVYEHTLVSPNDLSRIDAAFFTVNGWIGILFLGAVTLGVKLA